MVIGSIMNHLTKVPTEVIQIKKELKNKKRT